MNMKDQNVILEGQSAFQYHEYEQKNMKSQFIQIAQLIKDLNLYNPFVLDLGCASGLLMYEIFKTVPNSVLYGLDNSTTLLEIGERNLKDEYIYFSYSDDAQLPFCENSFDLIVSHREFHIHQDKLVYEEIKRTLKPGGLLLLIESINDSCKSKMITNSIVDLNNSYESYDFNRNLKKEEYNILKQWKDKGLLFSVLKLKKLNVYAFNYIQSSAYKCINR